ncbi:MAG: 2'-deoxycytidine 5'-triphosphate deaminase [Planctomycetota bacterium]|nr:2'-deoxycytidine 5'-triphosphate deaminase [Planctomycetota bacterium]MCX8040430.1 2'-deoxycytidine 5'-triphosphate deaminase [Planctomycetota bacterium]MDW8373178.1 2'-deoxycytidine 5'-triphosphate deaminase [Planctomycetota bacterium]
MPDPDALALHGTATDDDIRSLIAAEAIASPSGIAETLIQPSSLDLTLSDEGYRLPGSLLPLPGERVADLLRAMALERLDLSRPVCLARGQVYVVRLNERFALPPGVEAYCNGKSSTGRVDVATRVLADGSPRYDRLPAGYRGAVWLELIPRSFHALIVAGVSLNQAIFFRGRQLLTQSELLAEHRRSALAWRDGRPCPEQVVFDGRVVMTADLAREIVGFVAKPTHVPLDLTRSATHSPEDFFEPLPRPRRGYLFLEQGRFYILATAERVVVPRHLAGEMVPYEATAGEFRAHYAGFFDPGWGQIAGRPPGAPAVLEVRPHQDGLIVRHGQPLCAMAYERLSRPCARPYGSCANTYADQDGPRLSKHFAAR